MKSMGCMGAGLYEIVGCLEKLDVPCIGPSCMSTWTPDMCNLQWKEFEVESERLLIKWTWKGWYHEVV